MLKYVVLVACLAELALSNKVPKKHYSLSSSNSSSSSSSSESSEEKMSNRHHQRPPIHMQSKQCNHLSVNHKDLIEIQAEGITAAFLASNLTKDLYKGKAQRHQQADQAVINWVQTRFLQYFRRYSLNLSQQEITQATNTYNSLKYNNFDSLNKTGVLIDIPNQDLENIIDALVEDLVITETAARRMKFILDSAQPIHNSEDFIRQNTDGLLAFTRFAYISTTASRKDSKRGSVVFMFRSYKFQFAPIFTTEVTNQCALWGMICQTQVKVTKSDPGLTEAQATDMANYMQYRSSRDYDEQAGTYIDHLLTEAKMYERFQPTLFHDDWAKIDQHPNQDPSKVLPERNALNALLYLDNN